jgi:hypothetical protein
MSFDSSRLRQADRIVGGGAIALFIFLFFFKWYGVSSSSSIGGVNFSDSANGWHSFANSRWIWLITIIVALAAVAVTAGVFKFNSPVQLSVVVAGLGTLSTLLILYRIVHHPSAGVSGTIAGVHYSASAGIKIGIWLGLIAAAAITYGGYLAMQAEGTSLTDVRDQASQAVSSATASMSSQSEGSSPTPPSDISSTPPAGGASAPGPTTPSTPPIPPPATPPE